MGERSDQTDFRFLVENSADGIVVVDPSGTILFANPAAHRLFDRHPNELVGRSLGLPLVADAAAEVQVRTAAGSDADVEMRAVSTLWNGTPAILATLRDVSQRRIAEEQLRQAQKMEAVGRISAGVAHDFNNLLTVILGNLEIAQTRLDQGAPSERAASAMARAREGARRAAKLTGQLLAFSRRQPLRPEPVDLGRLLHDLSELLERTVGDRIRLVVDVAPEVWPALADRGQLETAIVNLVMNAKDAIADAGTVHVTATNDPSPDGDRVCIAVADSGSGIADEVMPRVFEPFFTTKGTGHGTGLGLSQVYGFVQQTGGEVAIDSEVGRGTTIRLWLPRSAAEARLAPEAAAGSTSAPQLRGGCAVLLVEDERAVRDVARNALEDLGCNVAEARDSQEALAFLESDRPFDLMLSDVALPGGLDGRALAARARALRSSMPVLLMTAYAGDLLQDGRLDPSVRLLSKPFSAAKLQAAVAGALAGREPRRILVVEDNPEVRSVIVRTLVAAGCHATEADSFARAQVLIKADAHGLDAAIVDLGLPDGRGDQLIDQLVRLRPACPVVAITGHPGVDPSLQPLASHRSAMLQKPFESAELIGALERVGALAPVDGESRREDSTQ